MDIYIYIFFFVFFGGGLEVGSLIVGRVCFHPRHEGGPGVSKTTVVSHRFFYPRLVKKYTKSMWKPSKCSWKWVVFHLH